MAPRFFADLALTIGESVRLPADAAHHAVRVLRLRTGDGIVLFNGRGGEYRAAISQAGGDATAEIQAFDPVERESPLALTLLQALVAAEKLDWIVEKAVELGAARLVIGPADRSVARLGAARAAKRLDHLRNVARAACCQCGRNRIPAVDYCPSLDAMLASVPSDVRRLVLSPGARDGLPSPGGGNGVALLVGPEGGLTAAEEQMALRAGFAAARMGPRILRAETAGIAALAALQALGGDLAADTR